MEYKVFVSTIKMIYNIHMNKLIKSILALIICACIVISCDANTNKYNEEIDYSSLYEVSNLAGFEYNPEFEPEYDDFTTTNRYNNIIAMWTIDYQGSPNEVAEVLLEAFYEDYIFDNCSDEELHLKGIE